jgi:small subunit ribosomal protein S17
MTETQQEINQEAERQRAFRKVRLGRVVSDKMEKTVVVQVSDRKSHPLYKKVMQRRVRFKAHDEGNQCKIGDLVRIMETRPLSKDKRWRVVEVVEKAR